MSASILLAFTFCQFDLEPATPEVRQWMSYLTQERKQQTQRGLKRSEFYVARFQAIFRDHGVPEELVWIPLIESGFRPSPVSHSGAAGMFQFKQTTARAFGLRIEGHRDERNHPFLAADACAKYLAYLHQKFGSWELVLAAYNLGEGDVRRAMARRGKHTWRDVRSHLRPETQAYVPKVRAAAIIGRRYMQNLENQERPPMHEYVVKQGDTLYAIANLFEIGVGELRMLNGLDSNEIVVDQVIMIPAKD